MLRNIVTLAYNPVTKSHDPPDPPSRCLGFRGSQSVGLKETGRRRLQAVTT